MTKDNYQDNYVMTVGASGRVECERMWHFLRDRNLRLVDITEKVTNDELNDLRNQVERLTRALNSSYESLKGSARFMESVYAKELAEVEDK